MRKEPVVAALLMVLGVAACQRKQVAVDDTLKKDLDLASSSEGLSLAPSGPSQKIESAIERSPQMPVTHAHVKAFRKTSAPKPVAPSLTMTPVAAVVPTALTSVMARPHPVEVAYPAAPASPPIADVPPNNPGDESWPDGVQYGSGRRGSGSVIRGGTVDGDHCDPRPPEDRPPIAINNQMPTVRGTF